MEEMMMAIVRGDWCTSLHLLDYANEIEIDWNAALRKVDGVFSDTIIERRLESLKYVTEASTAHMFWVRINLETTCPNTAARRLVAVTEKVKRVIRSYAKPKGTNDAK